MNNIGYGYGYGYGYGSGQGYGYNTRTNNNFSELNINPKTLSFPSLFGQNNNFTIHQKGYGVDLDGDGQFQGNKDGILAFDVNRDGRIDDKEITESQRRLKLLTEGPKKGNGIGGMVQYAKDSAERAALLKQYDKDGDGKLNNYELQSAGAKMLVDRNSDGQFTGDEAQNINNIRTRSGRFSLNELNLGTRLGGGPASSSVSRRPSFCGGGGGWGGWGGGGWGGGCGGGFPRFW
jgi:hypothetical protein